VAANGKPPLSSPPMKIPILNIFPDEFEPGRGLQRFMSVKSGNPIHQTRG